MRKILFHKMHWQLSIALPVGGKCEAKAKLSKTAAVVIA